MNNIDSKPAIMKNVTASPGHWLNVQLIGDVTKKSPRDATGASVFLTTGKMRQRQDVVSGGGYASQNDHALHFGLGAATTVDKLEIKWQDGSTQTIAVPAIDRTLRISEAKGLLK